MNVRVIHDDCLQTMRALVAEGVTVHSVVTDPPYLLKFMGKRWDDPGAFVERRPNRAVKFDQQAGNHNPCNAADAARTRHVENKRAQAWHEEWVRLAFNLLPPGGHLLTFGGTRTYHRLICAIEDAGFEIRDQIGWLYGSGFPKSHDVSKALDKMAGAEREVVGFDPTSRLGCNRNLNDDGWQKIGQQGAPITAPATEAARQWQGWGTALKPAWEPIVVARKPPAGTVAENVLKHGTGALNIDATRVGTTRRVPASHSKSATAIGATGISGKRLQGELDPNIGRWPANIVHDGSNEVLEAFAAFGSLTSGKPIGIRKAKSRTFGQVAAGSPVTGFGDTGTAARFYYAAKASKSERAGSKHPTIKPLALMRWLVRLVTPPGGTVFDPFAGSGTLGEAALLEGFNAILIEREAEYVADIHARLERVVPPLSAELTE